MHDQEISATSGAIVLEIQTAIGAGTSATPSADVPALEATPPEPSPQPEHTPNSAAAYMQQPLMPSTPVIAGSICDDLLTVVHGAPDAFPPLKPALEGILEIWKQCEVRHQLLYNLK